MGDQTVRLSQRRHLPALPRASNGDLSSRECVTPADLPERACSNARPPVRHRAARLADGARVREPGRDAAGGGVRATEDAQTQTRVAELPVAALVDQLEGEALHAVLSARPELSDAHQLLHNGAATAALEGPRTREPAPQVWDDPPAAPVAAPETPRRQKGASRRSPPRPSPRGSRPA
jgi:hypothetical protein